MRVARCSLFPQQQPAQAGTRAPARYDLLSGRSLETLVSHEALLRLSVFLCLVQSTIAIMCHVVSVYLVVAIRTGMSVLIYVSYQNGRRLSAQRKTGIAS